MSARARTPCASCARYWTHENGRVRRATRRQDRRLAKRWLYVAATRGADGVAMPLPSHTEGRESW